MRSLLLPLAALLLALAACGSSPPSDTDVTTSEAENFQVQVQAADPYMQQFTNPDDFKDVAGAVCDSFDGGQSYGLVSKTVAAHVRAQPSDAVVDTVIRVAVATSCPTMKGRAAGTS